MKEIVHVVDSKTQLIICVKVEYYKIKVPFFSSMYAEKKEESYHVQLSSVKGLSIRAFDEKPYKYIFLCIENLSDFSESLHKIIEKKYDLLKSVEVFFKKDVFTPLKALNLNAKKVLSSKVIENILPAESGEIVKYYRRRGSQWNLLPTDKLYSDFIFQKSDEKFMMGKEYIGYTGQSIGRLNSGKELNCTIYLKDKTVFTSHIFIENFPSVSFIDDNWIDEYYIMPDNILEQAEKEFIKVLKAFKDVVKITCPTKMFYHNHVKDLLFDIDADLKNNLRIKHTYNSRGNYKYDMHNVDSFILNFDAISLSVSLVLANEYNVEKKIYKHASVVHETEKMKSFKEKMAKIEAKHKWMDYY